MEDRNGFWIELDDSIDVPEPQNGDYWKHSFQGTVVGFKDKYVVIKDCNGDCWDIESEKLEIPFD